MQAQELFTEWALRNASFATDAGELELLRKMRGIFDDPENLRTLFGRVSGMVGSDVDLSLQRTLPSAPPGPDKKSTRILEKYLASNALLMSSVGDIVIARIRKAMRGDTTHRTMEALQEEFRNAAQATESRVSLWAVDQTLQLHADLTRAKHESVGIKRYFWTDSNDERVRYIHGDLGDRSDRGEAFAYSDPPVMSEDGRRGNPGDDYRCRCTAFPILD